MLKTTCRTCRSDNLTKFLDLGFTPLADQFLRKDQLREPETYYPLEVMICGTCGLAQLSYVVPRETVFQREYAYEAAVARTAKLHWDEFAQSVTERLQLGHEDLVVDVGSNIGVLLQAFKERGTRTLGVDPATHIAQIAESQGIETINDFFDVDVAHRIVANKGQACVITATNVFAHIDDLDSFMEAVSILLSPDGVFIIEAPYFVDLVKRFEYDTIYHEHLSYLSVKPLVLFFGRLGMDLFDIEQKDFHGGSLRIYVARAGKMPVSPIVNELLKLEQLNGVHSLDVLDQFSRDVQRNREELAWLVRNLKHEGKRLAAVSAPAKGMTLLNYCRLGTETLDFVTEKTALKIGRFTPGMHLPVVPDDELVRKKPDYALLLAWNFADEIMNNLSNYREKRGKFIIPIPRPRIVE